ncbi:MAG: FAD-binding oxidoreductase, partial [Ktedonobacteraceae bacterium]|nr:FAD-binding oxidoreductase [Ktedonobacteraceae bacterium]
ANVWSVALAREMGIELPITATRHPMVALHRPGDANEYTRMHAVCFDSTLGTYLRPDLGGITLVGAVANVLAASDPDHYPRGLSDEEIAHLSSAGAKHFPALARAVARGGWSGIYDDTPDYHPILGQLPAYDGLYCAVGFSGHGFKLSPTIGAWLAETILSGSTPADMQHFAYERFAQGKFIQPRYASGVLG